MATKDEFNQFEKDMNKLADAINDLGIDLSKIFQTFIDAIINFADEFDWIQRDDENIFEWGNRLQKESCLDNPEIRWEYQKAVWLWLPRKIKGWFGND